MTGFVLDGVTANNTATATTTVSDDTTPPVIVPTVSPAPNAAGWNNSDPAVSWSVSDPESGIASSSGCSSTTVSVETAGITFTCMATNGAGLAQSVSVTVQLDKTAPVLAFGAPSPAANAAGWNNGDVSIPFTASDVLSGIVSSSSTSPLLFATEGASITAAVTVTDAAGNNATFTSPLVNIDKTAPSIVGSRTPDPNAAGWNAADVTVMFACSDGLSGLAAGSPPPPTVVSTEGSNQAVGGACADQAGNVVSTGVTGINIDKTPPLVANVMVTPAAIPSNSSTILSADFSDSGGSNLSSASCRINSGAPVFLAVSGASASVSEVVGPFAGAGVYDVCVSDQDIAGNTGVESCVSLTVTNAPPVTALWNRRYLHQERPTQPEPVH